MDMGDKMDNTVSKIKNRRTQDCTTRSMYNGTGTASRLVFEIVPALALTLFNETKNNRTINITMDPALLPATAIPTDLVAYHNYLYETPT